MSKEILDDDDIRDMSIIAVNNLEQQGLIASDIDFDVQDIITESIVKVLNRKKSKSNEKSNR